MLATLYAIAVSFIMAGTSVVGKILAGYGFTPFFLAFFRFGISSLILFPFVSRNEFAKINRRDATYFLLLGVTGIFLFNVLFFAALRYTSIISVSLIGATNPIIALLIVTLINKNMPSRNHLLSLAFAFMGVCLIILSDNVSNSSITSSNLGEFLALAAVFCQISFALLIRYISNKFSSLFVTFMAGICGVICLVPFIINFNWSILLNLKFDGIFSLFYLGIISGAISTLLYAKTVKILGASSTNMIVFSLWPFFTCIIASFFGFTPTIWHLMGGILVLVALYIDIKGRKIIFR